MKDKRDQDMVLMSRLCKERNLLSGQLAVIEDEIKELESKIIAKSKERIKNLKT